MNQATTNDASITSDIGNSQPSWPKRLMKGWLWFSVALFFLVFFTILKAPEDRVKDYVVGMISSQLASQGISITADRGSITIGPGLAYALKGVTIHLPAPDAPIKVDKITVSPALIPLLSKQIGGNLWIYNGNGTLELEFVMKGKQISANFISENLDIGKLGLLNLIAKVKASGILSGTGSFSGDLNIPTSLTGNMKIDVKKIVVDQQLIQFFTIPRVNISQANAEVIADKGKVTVKSLALGKKGNATDDLTGDASGDITLGKTWESSTLNLKVHFNLSETLHKAFFLIDSFPQQINKTPDGTYGTLLTGPLFAIVATGAQ